jgi:uncharacterized tellurite resistance protein B-like protein
MGLFDAFKSSAPAMTSRHAYVASLVYMITVDGVVENEEISQLRGSLAQFSDAGDLLDWAIKYQKKNGSNHFLAEASPLLSDVQKMTILVNLADSLTSDGDADPSEQALFQSFLAAWNISEDRFRPFFEVIAMKNDRTVFLNQGDRRNDPSHRVSLSK